MVRHPDDGLPGVKRPRRPSVLPSLATLLVHRPVVSCPAILALRPHASEPKALLCQRHTPRRVSERKNKLLAGRGGRNRRCRFNLYHLR